MPNNEQAKQFIPEEEPLGFEVSPTIQEKNQLLEGEATDRAKFVLESLREPTVKILQTSVNSPEIVQGMIEVILRDQKFKNDPRLNGSPVSEKDIKITMAIIAEDVRRNAVFRGDESAEKIADDLILKLVGVGHEELGDLVRGASLLKGGNEEEMEKTEEEINKAGP